MLWQHTGGGLVAKSYATLATPWTVARQAPLSMWFSRQEHWSGLPLPSPGDLPNPGTEPRPPALQADLYRLSYKGSHCDSISQAYCLGRYIAPDFLIKRIRNSLVFFVNTHASLIFPFGKLLGLKKCKIWYVEYARDGIRSRMHCIWTLQQCHEKNNPPYSHKQKLRLRYSKWFAQGYKWDWIEFEPSLWEGHTRSLFTIIFQKR